MKKLLYILPLVAAVTLTSCGDDDENSNTPSGPPAGGMSAKIDGIAWTSPADNMMTAASPNSFQFTGMQVVGTTNHVITINAAGINGLGTYKGSMVDGSYTTGAQTWNTETDTTAATITLTKWDYENGLASGTFNFKATATGSATGTKTITEGAFNNVEF